MVTKNIRVVGYLPPPDHQKLRDYIEANNLSESAALVRIVKAFFEHPVPSEDSPAIFNANRSILGLIRIPSVIELLG